MHGNLEPEENVFPKEGSLSVVVPIDDFKIILRQMWKSRDTEPIIGKLYKKYTELTTFE
tara:strand:- start:389 stop:565 length:177 start_codon:yes stop_codon:yes gene_type:complete